MRLHREPLSDQMAGTLTQSNYVKIYPCLSFQISYKWRNWSSSRSVWFSCSDTLVQTSTVRLFCNLGGVQKAFLPWKPEDGWGWPPPASSQWGKAGSGWGRDVPWSWALCPWPWNAPVVRYLPATSSSSAPQTDPAPEQVPTLPHRGPCPSLVSLHPSSPPSKGFFQLFDNFMGAVFVEINDNTWSWVYKIGFGDFKAFLCFPFLRKCNNSVFSNLTKLIIY